VEAAWAKNIFDNVYDTIGFDESQITGTNLTAQGKPQWFGLTVNKSF
jgi:iron complex outermembrane receptor protein